MSHRMMLNYYKIEGMYMNRENPYFKKPIEQKSSIIWGALMTMRNNNVITDEIMYSMYGRFMANAMDITFG